MTPLTVRRTVQLEASPEEVWPLLAETDRVNRLIGLAPVRYHPVEPAAAATGARLVGETVSGGFHVRYEELPYEWTWPRRFGVLRRYHGGPLRTMRVHWALEARPEGGSALTVTLEVVPRLWVVRPVAWFNLEKAAAAITALGQQLDAFVRERGPNPYAEPVSPSDAAAVERAVADLVRRGVRPELAARVGLHLRAAPDADCVRIRPFPLADAWAEPRREVLAALLHAVSAGLVELRWSILCPSCVTEAGAVTTLASLGPEGHCELCDITWSVSLDEAVEATFFPNPAVRKVPEQLYCMAGPGRTPHVLVQANLDPGEQVEIGVPREGRLRLFVRGGARASVIVEAGAPERVEARFDERGLAPAEISVAPGGRILASNAGADTRHVKLERPVFPQAAASAHEVSTLPEFRALFSKDLLKPGTPLKVARAAILFTDLTGSTSLYAELGDAAAFRLVDDHFDLLRGEVAASGGTLVKTMGDAVMAAYIDESSAVRGALACLAAMERFRAEHPLGQRVRLKVGLQAGPSYVITANGALDYFGQTVNIASRLQHLAEGGELVLEARVWEALGEADRSTVQASAPFEVAVRGVPEPLRLVRLRAAT